MSSSRMLDFENERLTEIIAALSVKEAAAATDAVNLALALAYAEQENAALAQALAAANDETASAFIACEERIEAAAQENEARIAEHYSWTTTANWDANEARHRADGAYSAMLPAQHECEAMKLLLDVAATTTKEANLEKASLKLLIDTAEAATLAANLELSALALKVDKQRKQSEMIVEITTRTEVENQTLKTSITEMGAVLAAETECLHVERNANALRLGELCSSHELALSELRDRHTLVNADVADELIGAYTRAAGLVALQADLVADKRLLTLRAEGAEEATNILTLHKEASEATISKLQSENDKLIKLNERPFYRRIGTIRQACDGFAVGLLKLANVLLYIGYVMMLVFCALANAALRAADAALRAGTRAGAALTARRLRNLILIAAIYHVASHSIPTSTRSSSISGLGTWSDLQIQTRSRPFQGERVVAAVLSQPGVSDSVRRCLFDNGASENITSSYHGEIPGTRRDTEVPQGFQQGTGKLRCDSTFLARRDITGADSSKVARTLMTWQHTDATQFEIVSEAYLRDKMGCTFIDQPRMPRSCTFPDGTVLALSMTASGLGFARFTTADYSFSPMGCIDLEQSSGSSINVMYNWDE